MLEQAPTSQWDRPPVSPVGGVQAPVEPWAGQWSPPEADLVPWEGEPGDDEAQSDWQAAWEGWAGEPDPRIGRPPRTGTLLALLAALMAAAAAAPVVAAGVALLISWLARTADRSVTALVLRRYQRGRRRSDVPFAVAASPWHVVVGALSTLVSALLPLAVGVCAVFSASLALVAVTGGTPHPNSALPLAIGAMISALVAWWGPGGSGLRRGTRSIVRGISPGTGTTRILVLVLLAVAVGLTLWVAQRSGVPLWWPTQAPSSVLPSLGLG